MAIFNRKPKSASKTEAKTPVVSGAKKNATPVSGKKNFGHILRSPRVTEKAAIGTDHGVYVFNVEMKATKPMIEKAIIELFKVSPRKICIAAVPAVRVKTRQTGKDGYTNRGKKAYIYLNKGDKIDLA
jgi:large subunit ribosomal protein L23